MGYNTIIVEKQGRIGRVYLNRPEARNALSAELLQELDAAFEELDKDNEIRVIIITGKGAAFCAGADLKQAGASTQLADFIHDAQRIINRIEASPKPTIASINGLALAGGCELVLACDLAVMSEEAKIGDQHINFGLIPGGGGSQRLPRAIPFRKAKELLFTGDWLSAEEAKELGLVNKVVPADKLEQETMDLATKIAEKSPLGLKAVKLLANRGVEMALPDALELEANAIIEYFKTEDFAEGISAFIGKRKPEFKGK